MSFNLPMNSSIVSKASSFKRISYKPWITTGCSFLAAKANAFLSCEAAPCDRDWETRT